MLDYHINQNAEGGEGFKKYKTILVLSEVHNSHVHHPRCIGKQN